MSETPHDFALFAWKRAEKELEHVKALRIRASNRVEQLEAENKRLKKAHETMASELRVIEQTKMQLTLWLEERGDEIEELKLEVIRLKKQLEGES